MSLDFLRSPDDERAEAALHRARERQWAKQPKPTEGDCPFCGVVETMMLGDRCHQCHDAARDSQANREMCRLIHGG